MDVIKKKNLGILLAGLYLILVSIIFIISQLVLAFKMDWTFSDFPSTLIIIKWFVYIIAGVGFFIGSVDLVRRKRRGWWVGNIYFSLLTVISVFLIYECSKALADYGGKNELFPAFVAIVLGWLNCLLLMIVWPKIKEGATKKLISSIMVLLILSGLVAGLLSLVVGSSQLQNIVRHGQSGGKDSILILFSMLKVFIITGGVGVIVLGGVEIVRQRFGLFKFGILASAFILLGGIGFLLLGLHVLEKNLGFFIDWAQVLISIMGFIISSFFLIYLLKRKSFFS